MLIIDLIFLVIIAYCFLKNSLSFAHCFPKKLIDFFVIVIPKMVHCFQPPTAALIWMSIQKVTKRTVVAAMLRQRESPRCGFPRWLSVCIVIEKFLGLEELEYAKEASIAGAKLDNKKKPLKRGYYFFAERKVKTSNNKL